MRRAITKCTTCSRTIAKRSICTHCLKDQRVMDKIGLHIFTAFVDKLSRWTMFETAIEIEPVHDKWVTVKTLHELFTENWNRLTADGDDAEAIVQLLSNSIYFQKQCNELDPNCKHVPDFLRDYYILLQDLRDNMSRWLTEFEKWEPKIYHSKIQSYITPGNIKHALYFRI